MSTSVKVSKIPDCDICKARGRIAQAFADAKLSIGPWANVCHVHFKEYGCSLGTGRGQKYLLAE